MTENFTQKYYPLNLQCGRKTWTGAQLTPQFGRDPRPERTYFRHLLADYLRRESTATLSAAKLELLATLNLVLRRVADEFLDRRRFRAAKNRFEVAGKVIDQPDLEKVFVQFLWNFPAVPIELKQTDSATVLRTLDEQQQIKELLLELILLYVQSRNPALEQVRPLFSPDEQELQKTTAYRRQLQLIDAAIPEWDDGFAGRPQTLLARLLEPLQRATTLYDQLQLLQQLWAEILPADLLARISSAFEQYEKEGFQPGFPGEPEAIPLDPAAFIDEEYADFTADLDWMPRTVLLAKSIYVWLEQLSRKYRRLIRRLDQIPDEELDELSGYGFTSLWLIGIWQRSKASRKVKNLCGQLQVAASAYAIADYRVADDLGGDDALQNLRDRCRLRGIDLACDVVTNHTGIESAWLREHPDWFVQLPYPPYPGYRFSGPDLSEDSEYAIQIEDGYYDHSEAAVVCRYQQRRTGEVRYIYHGNDGTHLPWNDTVQLNYLLADVREAMIRLIIQVARRFRIIRFDAAMTLAKRHFQRLWYPLPGGGAGVPSRSDHAMSQDDFNRFFPVEFWRELVDRIRAEAPDTLLVAEAFWLMEGYFVRTLGMHRVYNSAFMNMLKQEENSKYRQTLKNILIFDPAILQRFVNFMSNPDEKPAIEQFGDGDKYFCVATLLATMPGLPMFGHGQIEGLREKYGMEYLLPRWDEQADVQLLERHKQQLFPLLRKRALFSGAERFQLYDFISSYGVEEDVYAYSNRLEERTALVLCNNSPNSIAGRIGSPVPMSDKEGISFLDACSIDISADFVLMSDIGSGLQFLQPASSLRSGGDYHLAPYCHRVLTEFSGLADPDGRWQQLWQRYGDLGRRNLVLEHDALLVEPTWEPVQELLAMSRPERAKRRAQQLLEQVCDLYVGSPLNGMSREYVLEILVQTQFPEAVLDPRAFAQLTELLTASVPVERGQLFRLLDRFCNHRQFRTLLNCHYYDYVDWFGRDELERLCLVILQFQLFCDRHVSGTGPESLARRERIIAILRQLRQAMRLAEQLGYRTDELLQRLDRTPIREDILPADKQGLKILFVASEATPFAKSGGLADVAGSLPRGLRQLGHDVRVVLPCYRAAEHSKAELYRDKYSVEIRLQGTAYRAGLKWAGYDGVPYWFLDAPEFFDRDALYGTADGDYPDNGLRFGFFGRAVLEMCKTLDFRPDLIHLHDWQTGFIPVLLKTCYNNQDFFAATGTLLTIHNLGYQGMFPMGLLRQLELPYELSGPSGMEYYGNLSALKGGIVYSDLVNTVSPTYCREIQSPEQGHGFDGILRDRSQDLHGIINGLDSRVWDPAKDTFLAHNYSSGDLAGKRACKKALQRELELELRQDRPVIAVISRLDRQKGIDLLQTIWPELLERAVQFVLLGSGSHQQMQFWKEQQNRYPGQVSVNLTFDEGLSHRIYAAADLLLVPSLYEPCGLTQMIALSYGALPVVRRTGGLADTVVDVDEAPQTGYGFVFERSDPQELLQAIDRGLDIYSRRRRWLELVKRGMALDFSWTSSAEQYQELYRKIMRQE